LIKKQNRPSKPGAPPHAYGKSQLKKFLFFKYDPSTRSVVIGPEKLGHRDVSVPQVLEKGGSGRIRNTRRIPRAIGDGGVIQIAGVSLGNSRGKATGKTQCVRIDSKGKKRTVAFVRLQTDNMVRRAEQLEEKLYGPMFLPAIKARPFMKPALEKVKPSMAGHFRDRIR